MCSLKANINIDSGGTSCGPGPQLPEQAGFPTVPALCFYPLRQPSHCNFSIRLVCIVPFFFSLESQKIGIWCAFVLYLIFEMFNVVKTELVCKKMPQMLFLWWNLYVITLINIITCYFIWDIYLTQWNKFSVFYFYSVDFWALTMMMKMPLRVHLIAALLICCK